MKKINLLILLVCSTFLLQAQNVATLFSSIPDNMLLPVDSLQRLDIMDLYKAGKTPEIVNGFSDTTRLQSLSDDYLSVKTGNSTVELALLPLINDSKIICLIKTVCVPACDSRLEFYTTEWKPLDTNLFITPVADTWFFKNDVDPDNEYFKSVKFALNMSLMEFHLDKDNLTLSQNYTSPQFLSSEDRKKAEVYLKKDSKKYIWNKAKFE